MQRGLPVEVQGVDLGPVLEQQVHDVVVRLVRCQVERRQHLLVLLVEVGALAAEEVHRRLALRVGGPHGAVQGRVAGVRVLEVEEVGGRGGAGAGAGGGRGGGGGQALLGLGGVREAAGLQQEVALVL